jgi:hypothetical protein
MSLYVDTFLANRGPKWFCSLSFFVGRERGYRKYLFDLEIRRYSIQARLALLLATFVPARRLRTQPVSTGRRHGHLAKFSYRRDQSPKSTQSIVTHLTGEYRVNKTVKLRLNGVEMGWVRSEGLEKSVELGLGFRILAYYVRR